MRWLCYGSISGENKVQCIYSVQICMVSYIFYFTGGNCLTTMIATISLEMTNLSESISTCRFAQRVSCISNIARFVKLVFH